MKRRVIQIAKSTQLISLPRKWAKKYGIKKGDELDIEVEGSTLKVSTDRNVETNVVEINIDDLGPMVSRVIHALYKRGVDEIKILYSDPSNVSLVQQAIGKEVVGFEIVDQGSSFCVVKQVQGELDDFDSILRRTFLLLSNMSNELLKLIGNNDFSLLKNIAFLEEANNRFTTACRRMLNKKGHKIELVGPLYYIIEDLENLADEFKYLCNDLYEYKDKSVKVSKPVLAICKKVNELIEGYHSLFYKQDYQMIVKLAKLRKEIISSGYKLFNNKLANHDLILIHHMLVITQKSFCMVGPYMVIKPTKD